MGQHQVIIVDKKGIEGVADQTGLQANPVWVALPDGRKVPVPKEILGSTGGSRYELGVDFDDLDDAGETETHGERITIPVIEEELLIGKRKVRTGLRVRKTVMEHEEVVEEPSIRQEISVERVPVNQPVDGPVPVRTEGETTIIPVLEEVTVVKKQWILREEVRVTRKTVSHVEPRRMTLRREEAKVEPIERQELGDSLE